MTTATMTFAEYSTLYLPQRIMESGLGTRPEESYLEVPEEPERDFTVYGVGSSEWTAFEYGFIYCSLEEAEHLLASNAFSIKGDSVVKHANKIFIKKVWSPEALKAHAGVLEQIRMANDYNGPIERSVREYDGEINRIQADLWEEWHEHTGRLREEQRIRDTYADYLKTARDDVTIAFEFLAKTFSSYEAEKLREIVG